MSLSEKVVNINSLEKEIFRKCCQLGCELLKMALEQWDEDLSKSRDRSVYRYKEKRKTVLKTVMGEVDYYRIMYEKSDSEGLKSYVYLLDEAMGISGSGYMSGLLSEQIVHAVCKNPYREAARTISELTGQNISHTAAWNVVQELGKKVEEQEDMAAQQVANQGSSGDKETKVLFEEQDGICLKLQGKSRKKHGKNKEMKLAIAYDGMQKVGKKRRKLTNKVACANFESAKKFVKRKEGIIGQTYNIDEIRLRLLNGDGARWIKESLIDETVHFQLDPYHRNKAITQYVKDPGAKKVIRQLLKEQEIKSLLEVIQEYANSASEEKERDNYVKLLSYFSSNAEGLVPFHERVMDIPQAPAGKEYGHLGTMEGNIFTILGNRMKGGRACWSIDGGNNLARLLCLKFTDKLSDTLQNLTASFLSERYAEEVSTELSAAKVVKSVGKGYDGFHESSIPSTPNFKWLRNLAAPRAL